MSKTAGRLAQALSNAVMTRETLIDSLPPGTRLTFVVQLGTNGAIKQVYMQTSSNIGPDAVKDRDGILPNGQR